MRSFNWEGRWYPDSNPPRFRSKYHIYDKKFLLQVQCFLPPATKLGQGYVFTGVCHSVNRGSASVHAGIPPPPTPRKENPLPRRPPKGGTPQKGEPPKEAPPKKEAPPPPKETPQKEAPPRNPIAKETPPEGGTPKGDCPKKEAPPERRHPQEEPPAKETPQKEAPPKEGEPPCQGDPPKGGPQEREHPQRRHHRPTPKGEIEGGQIQAHTKGGN